MKRKEIIHVYDLTYIVNQYLRSNDYIAIDINAMDYDEDTNSLYFVPRYYRSRKEKKKYKNDILILSDGSINKIKISENTQRVWGYRYGYL